MNNSNSNNFGNLVLSIEEACILSPSWGALFSADTKHRKRERSIWKLHRMERLAGVLPTREEYP